MNPRINNLLTFLKPDWKTVANDLPLSSTDSLVLFCSHSAVAGFFDTQGYPHIYLIQPENRAKLSGGVKSLTEDEVEGFLAQLSSGQRVINLLEWDSSESPLTADDSGALNRFIRTHFHIVKGLIRVAHPIHYTIISSATGALGGFARGLGLSVRKEAPHVNTQVLEVNVLTQAVCVDLESIDLTNPVLKMENGQVMQLALQEVVATSVASSEVMIHKEKLYVITGNGRIAKILARHLKERYGCRVVIFGLFDLTPSEQAELKECGVSAYLKLDLGDLQQLKEAWAYLEGEGAIGGLFHLAGVLNDKLLINKSIDEFLRTVHSKVQCTLNLDRVSATTTLDFFVCFSSLSGLVGNIGQTDYSAANSFLDNYVLYREGLVKKGARHGFSTSINWGLWAAGGMKIPFEQDVLLPMEAPEALEALEKTLSLRASRCVIFKGDRTVLAPLVPNSPSQARPINHEETLNQIVQWVRESVVEFTKLSDLDDNTSLLSQGIDSVATINITSALEKDLKEVNSAVRIIKTIIFDHPSILALARYLKETFPNEVSQLFPSEAPAAQEAGCEEIASSGAREEEDVAIVGISGQFPKSDTVDSFWNHLLQGEDLVTEIPPERWDWRMFYDSNPQATGKSYGRHGAFLDSIKRFDARFFNIAPAEAEKIDPQERLFLQNVYHALEDGCLVPNPMDRIGVFVSIMYGHYTLYDHSDYVIDSSYASIANRASFYFNFKGPSIAIDTMCSGSLTALHLAQTSLKKGECTVAVVGGVNLMPHPAKYRMLSQGHFLSPSGRCHSFGKDADGYVPGEGVVALVLKLRDKARADEDHIYGVILGSAINSSGRTAGYSVPAASAQSAVIREALENAQVPSSTITYVEAHGTGTSLGDPIEIQGLSEGFQTKQTQFCSLGSLKSNVGHLESAAGLASIVKVLMQFQHKTIAPTLHCTDENPLLNLSESPFILAKDALPWSPPEGIPRRAGISSFGAGGSNAHVILEEHTTPTQGEEPSLPHYLFPLSAKSPKSLKEKVAALKEWLEKNGKASLYGVASTLARGREHFRYRLALVASTFSELFTGLDNALQKGEWNTYKTSLTSSSHTTIDIEQIKEAYYKGQTIDWKEIYPRRSVLPLPTYPFEEKEYWSEAFEQSILPRPATSIDTQKVHYLYPVWTPQDMSETNAEGPTLNFDKKLLLKDGEAAIDRLLETEQSDGPLTLAVDLNEIAFDDESDLFHSFFELCQGLIKRRLSCQFVLVLRCRGKLKEVFLSALTGFFKSLFLENGKIRTKFIYLESVKSSTPLSSIVSKETPFGSVGFQEIFYRNEERFIKDYDVQPSPSEAGQPKLKEGGVYLITGGMGKIGQILTRYLLKNWGAHVALLGSSPLNERKESTLSSLEKEGGSVAYFRVDIQNRKAVEKCVKTIGKRWGKINGIIHSAGRLRDKLFSAKGFDDFMEVLSVKLKGAVHLDLATKGEELDFFLLFSSLASVFGNVGQTDYAAANAFLDAFASHRGKGTVSINWPLWLDGGMQIDADKVEFMFEQQGLVPISEEEGVGAFLNTLALPSDTYQCAVIKGDLNKVRTQLMENSSVQAQEAGGRDNATLDAFLAESIVKILKISADQVDEETTFGEYGFDSVTFLSLSDRISEKYSVQLPPSAFFTFDTLHKLKNYLLERVEVKPAKEVVQKGVKVATTPQRFGRPAYAIVGMDGILPGARSLDAFWNNMLERINPVRQVKRWPSRNHFGGLVFDIDHFDPKFFSLSTREAMLMDPQHRLFLQVAYNTFLDAGYNPNQMKNTGVFAGVQFNDYQILLQQWKQSRHPYAATGNAHAMLANRISYLLDLKGPSQTIDSACSSAIAALNRAIISLERGECDAALIGAVSLLIDHEVTDAAKSMGVLSPSNRCATFDKAADGYVRGEGAGCVLVKRYEEAVEDGNHIYGVILGCSENHGGRSHSLTAPNPEAQKALLKHVYGNAEMARQVSYIEAHGTGTALGDPIEIDALKMAWSDLGAADVSHTVEIGSVKTHVGHLEPAAGIASLIKVLLCLKHKTLPSNLHFNEINPYIDLSGSPFHILADNLPWESPGPRVAGISSFGFGGSNAHVIVHEAPKREAKASLKKPAYLVTLSAKSLRSFKQLLENMGSFLKESAELPPLADIAYTLNVGRPHFTFRRALVVQNHAELKETLAACNVDELKAIKPQEVIKEIMGKGDYLTKLDQWKEAYEEGYRLPWEELHQGESHLRVSLPTYPFDTQPYWFEGAADSELIREVSHV